MIENVSEGLGGTWSSGFWLAKCQSIRGWSEQSWRSSRESILDRTESWQLDGDLKNLTALHVLLAIMNTLDWEIKMMDIKGGYLHSMLQEEIYMRQPDGFDNGSGWVLKLQWALYGLKQLGRTWHQRLCGLLLSLRFWQSLADECIYIRQDKNSIEVISVYVDDFGLFTDSKGGMIKLKGELKIGRASCRERV